MILKNVSWSVLGNAGYALSQWLMLVVLAKWSGADALGVFALALAVIAPIFALSNGDQRAAQATDVHASVTFARYLGFRWLGTLVAGAMVVVIALSGFLESAEGVRATALLFVARAAESFSDVVHGQFHQQERLDYVGQSLLVRSLLQGFCFSGVVFMGGGLDLALAAYALVAIALWCFWDMPRLRRIGGGAGLFRPDFRGVGLLLMVILPFGMQVFINVLFQNVPRYFVQSHLDSASLGIFSSVAYFVVAGAVLVNAVSQATMPRFARYFAEGSLQYVKLLIQFFLVCLAACVAGTWGVWLFGEQLLVTVYSQEFAGAGKLFFVIALFASTLYLSVVPGTALTAARAMKGQTHVNIVSLVVLVLGCYVLVPRYGLLGAAWAMVIGTAVKTLGMFALVAHLCWLLVARHRHAAPAA